MASFEPHRGTKPKAQVTPLPASLASLGSGAGSGTGAIGMDASTVKNTTRRLDDAASLAPLSSSRSQMSAISHRSQSHAESNGSISSRSLGGNGSPRRTTSQLQRPASIMSDAHPANDTKQWKLNLQRGQERLLHERAFAATQELRAHQREMKRLEAERSEVIEGIDEFERNLDRQYHMTDNTAAHPLSQTLKTLEPAAQTLTVQQPISDVASSKPANLASTMNLSNTKKFATTRAGVKPLHDRVAKDTELRQEREQRRRQALTQQTQLFDQVDAERGIEMIVKRLDRESEEERKLGEDLWRARQIRLIAEAKSRARVIQQHKLRQEQRDAVLERGKELLRRQAFMHQINVERDQARIAELHMLKAIQIHERNYAYCRGLAYSIVDIAMKAAAFREITEQSVIPSALWREWTQLFVKKRPEPRYSQDDDDSGGSDYEQSVDGLNVEQGDSSVETASVSNMNVNSLPSWIRGAGPTLVSALATIDDPLGLVSANKPSSFFGSIAAAAAAAYPRAVLLSTALTAPEKSQEGSESTGTSPVSSILLARKPSISTTSRLNLGLHAPNQPEHDGESDSKGHVSRPKKQAQSSQPDHQAGEDQSGDSENSGEPPFEEADVQALLGIDRELLATASILHPQTPEEAELLDQTAFEDYLDCNGPWGSIADAVSGDKKYRNMYNNLLGAVVEKILDVAAAREPKPPVVIIPPKALSVVILGKPFSGKHTIARALEKRFALRVLDADEIIMNVLEAARQSGVEEVDERGRPLKVDNRRANASSSAVQPAAAGASSTTSGGSSAVATTKDAAGVQNPTLALLLSSPSPAGAQSSGVDITAATLSNIASACMLPTQHPQLSAGTVRALSLVATAVTAGNTANNVAASPATTGTQGRANTPESLEGECLFLGAAANRILARGESLPDSLVAAIIAKSVLRFSLQDALDAQSMSESQSTKTVALRPPTETDGLPKSGRGGWILVGLPERLQVVRAFEYYMSGFDIPRPKKQGVPTITKDPRRPVASRIAPPPSEQAHAMSQLQAQSALVPSGGHNFVPESQSRLQGPDALFPAEPVFTSALDIVLYLNVDDTTALRRAHGRAVDPATGAVYARGEALDAALESRPDVVERLVPYEDAKLAKLPETLAAIQEQKDHIFCWFKSFELLHVVNAETSQEEVEREAFGAISHLISLQQKVEQASEKGESEPKGQSSSASDSESGAWENLLKSGGQPGDNSTALVEKEWSNRLDSVITWAQRERPLDPARAKIHKHVSDRFGWWLFQDQRFATLLAERWIALEATYTSRCKRLLHMLRSERLYTLELLASLRNNYLAFLMRPDSKQRHIREWQANFNAIPQDLRRDPQTKDELFVRIEELGELLYKETDQRLEEGERELDAIRVSGSVEHRVFALIVTYLCMMQLEVDRYLHVTKIIQDFYASLVRVLLADDEATQYAKAAGATAQITLPPTILLTSSLIPFLQTILETIDPSGKILAKVHGSDKGMDTLSSAKVLLEHDTSIASDHSESNQSSVAFKHFQALFGSLSNPSGLSQAPNYQALLTASLNVPVEDTDAEHGSSHNLPEKPSDLPTGRKQRDQNKSHGSGVGNTSTTALANTTGASSSLATMGGSLQNIQGGGASESEANRNFAAMLPPAVIAACKLVLDESVRFIAQQVVNPAEALDALKGVSQVPEAQAPTAPAPSANNRPQRSSGAATTGNKVSGGSSLTRVPSSSQNLATQSNASSTQGLSQAAGGNSNVISFSTPGDLSEDQINTAQLEVPDFAPIDSNATLDQISAARKARIAQLNEAFETQLKVLLSREAVILRTRIIMLQRACVGEVENLVNHCDKVIWRRMHEALVERIKDEHIAIERLLSHLQDVVQTQRSLPYPIHIENDEVFVQTAVVQANELNE